MNSILKVTDFDFCALVIFVFLLVSTIFRNMTKGRANLFFLSMLIVSIVSVAADICAATLDNLGGGNVKAKYFFHTIYLFTHNLVAPYYFFYLVTLTDSWHKLRENKIRIAVVCVPVAVIVAEFLANPFFKNVFYISQNGEYIRGKHIFVLYFFAAYFLVCGFVYIFRYRNFFSVERLISLVSLFPLIVTATIIQFFQPEFLIEMFANSCALLFISMMIQRPEETIDVETGLGRMSWYVSSVKHAYQNKKSMDIILIDVENYEAIKQVLGYEETNSAMKNLAEFFTSTEKDFLFSAEWFHLGEGKFRCIVDPKFFEKTVRLAEFLNDELKKNFPHNRMELNLVSRVCLVRCPDDIDDADSVLAFGKDLRLIKNSGKVFFASTSFKKERYDVMKNIDRIIERALLQKKFQVYYQPIFSLNENRFNSAEALLRLCDDEHGFISPEDFIPAAEKSGAIQKIGTFVLHEVFAFIASDEFKNLNLDYIEINLSVAQCMQNDLANQILNLMDEYKISAEKINLEITETAASLSQKTMMDNLLALHERGIKFSLDDFGTGYSNMQRIASLPLHIVKLDKSFTRTDENPKLEIILLNSIKMIKAMNMKIVVEGIETESMLNQFKNLQCEFIQGYYYSKPIPKNDFVEFIRTHN
jgi:EAL domain-containing protein (putative c-di-GMP-specific phosphodiesterase class I)/GGDEF domain-containing protein